jgi:plasmid stabilization system protein ParE
VVRGSRTVIGSVKRAEVTIAPAAEREIGDAYLWYRGRNPIAAEMYRDEVFLAIDRISEAPSTWPADSEGTRRFLLRRFPYTVFYEFADNRVTVLAVAHQHRRPDYWRRRPGAGGAR